MLSGQLDDPAADTNHAERAVVGGTKKSVKN